CVAVDRFIHDEDAPGHIHAVESRGMSAATSDAIWTSMFRHVLRMSEFDGLGHVRVPGFEINEGDWVWTGDDAQLVASSAYDHRWSVEVAVYALALLSARHANGTRLYWCNPARALEIFVATIQEYAHLGRGLDGFRDDARRVEVADLAACGLPWEGAA